MSGIEFLAELGHGSMGQVLLARQLPSGRLVAVKRLGSGRLGGAQRSRLRREARVLQRLDHPNVVRLLELLQVGDELLLVLEYIDGPSLRALAGRQRLRVADALLVIDHVHRALAHAHGVGVIHRDVKPTNVLISPHGLCKLTDFGLARLDGIAGRASRTVLTRPGHPLGTASYMAPEAAVGSTDLDHRADLYSLGVMAYELLAGRLPFPAELGTANVLRAHVNDPVPPPTTADPAFPPELEPVLLQALEKSRDRRQETVAQFWEQLEAAADLARPGWRGEADLPRAVVDAAADPLAAAPVGRSLPEGAGIGASPALPVLDPIPPSFPDLGRRWTWERSLVWVLVAVVGMLGLALLARTFA